MDIKTSVLNVNKRPTLVTMDYIMNIPEMGIELGLFLFIFSASFGRLLIYVYDTLHAESFRLSYYPHRLDEFKGLLKEAFGEASAHTVFADFKSLEEEPEPAFYIHLVEKPAM